MKLWVFLLLPMAKAVIDGYTFGNRFLNVFMAWTKVRFWVIKRE